MKIFTQHPASVGENYFQHMGSALSFALPLLGAFLACLVHALLPFLFEKTGSRLIVRLHERMVTHRHRQGPHSASQSASQCGAQPAPRDRTTHPTP
ncbi:capsule biosynthesis protein [Pandoraea morbifera]|uniref:Capsule biosynthesis protein n=1 Tax=Pandoraea morbifera TaxID=2508300 RepID=A0A5E4Y4C9_9BURK|nr:DUF6356 family protein [Pandoraea morbifera]VVE43486.1 capsule biosynthesis protein [Pandoraea morbifera]